MGDVVNIRRSTDDDLLVEFTKACPAIPAAVDTSVLNAADRALGSPLHIEKTVQLPLSEVSYWWRALL